MNRLTIPVQRTWPASVAASVRTCAFVPLIRCKGRRDPIWAVNTFLTMCMGHGQPNRRSRHGPLWQGFAP
jgi:hypothetical protein